MTTLKYLTNLLHGKIVLQNKTCLLNMVCSFSNVLIVAQATLKKNNFKK